MSSPEITLESPWPGDPLAAALSPCDRPVPLLGAGISAGCGLPTGDQLASWMLNHDMLSDVDFSPLSERKRSNPLFVAQTAINADPSVRESLLSAVHRHLRRIEARADLSPTLRSIARTPNYPGLVLTLNYDRLVERAAAAAGRSAETLTLEDVPALIADGFSKPSSTLRVLHLHGTLGDDASTLVLDAESYAAQAQDARVADLFTAVLAFYNVCILGTSFEEKYLSVALQRRRPSVPRHVIVCDVDVAGSIIAGDSPLTVEEHNILVCDYPTAAHEVLEPFCERLVKCTEEADVDGETIAVESPSPDPKYSERRAIAREAADETVDESLEMRIALGSIPIIDESELQSQRRAVVVGVPGSGKTWTMRRFAEKPVAGERPVLIRLRDVRDTVGDPSELLKAWVEAGATLDGGQAIARSSLERESVRLHVLLDGLDELPSSHRSQTVEAIKRVADSHQAHRFTVSSRSVSALSQFDGEWAQFELLCDSDWRDSLLSKFNLTRGDLEEMIGNAFEQVEPLLKIPFYLRATIRLAEAETQFSDAMDLALGLVKEFSLADPALRAVGGRLAEWLDRVALTMAINGATSLSLEVLEQLADGLELGDVETVTDLLASRALLLMTGDRYAFSHRLLGEALAAARLENEDPEPWLDVIAPIVTGRSAVREEWMGTMQLLLPRSPMWRDRLFDRDSFEVARNTPASADEGEREKSARLLWRRASDLDIWIQSRQLGRGSNDGEVVSKLLAAGGCRRLIGEVRAALHSESRYERGNALEVLVGMGSSDSESVVRSVLARDPDPVVRRSAASWARRLDLRRLLPSIAARAISSDDELEKTDMASIAMKLARPEERFGLSLRLALSGNSSLHEPSILSDMSSTNQIFWLAEVARDRVHPSWWFNTYFDDLVRTVRRPSATTSARIAFLAAIQHHDSKTVNEFIRKHRDGAATGLVDALDSGRVRSTEIGRALRTVGSELLATRGAPAEAIEMVEWWEGLIGGETVEMQAEVPGEHTDYGRERKKEPSSRSTLEEILEKGVEEMENHLLDHQHQLFGQASELSPSHRRKLIEYLSSKWADRNLRDEITVEGTGARMSKLASLVLSFGPPLRWKLDDRKWVELATCGWLFEQQKEWLRPQSNSRRASEAAEQSKTNPRAFLELVQVVKPLEMKLLIQALGRSRDSFSDAELSQLATAIQMRGSRRDVVRFAALGPSHRQASLEAMAAVGDPSAQRQRLEELAEELNTVGGNRIEPPDWLGDLQGKRFAPALKRLILAAGTSTREPFNYMLTAAQAALERVSPADAVVFYEKLIAEPPWEGAQFEVVRLESSIQSLTQRKSRRKALEIAGVLGLPC